MVSGNTLGDIAVFTNGGAWNQGEYSDDGIPVVRVTDIKNSSVSLKNCKYLPNTLREKYSKHLLETGDLVVCTVGSHPSQAGSVVGRTATIPKEANGTLLNQNAVIIRAANEKVIQGWLNYFARTDEFHSYIKSCARGAASQVRMSIELLKKMPVDVPDVNSQINIAKTLKTYDDLIENNSKRIEKLETMARLLYRHYFEVPEADDWEVLPISKLLTNHIGGGWGSEEQDESFLAPAYVIRGTDIPPVRSGDVSSAPLRYHKNSNLNSRALVEGDIIFEVSGGSKGQPLGRSLLVTKELLSRFDMPVICASFCKRVNPNAELLVPEILYLSFLDAYENGEIETYSVQSTGISNFKWTEYIARVTRRIPPYDLQLEFQSKVAVIHSQISILGKKNANLRHTRDLLIPHLMSGEIKL